ESEKACVRRYGERQAFDHNQAQPGSGFHFWRGFFAVFSDCVLQRRRKAFEVRRQNQDSVNLSGYLVAILDAVQQAKHASNSLAAGLMRTRLRVELGITVSPKPPPWAQWPSHVNTRISQRTAVSLPVTLNTPTTYLMGAASVLVSRLHTLSASTEKLPA